MILLDNAADGGLIYIQGRSSSCRRTTSSTQMNIQFDFDLCSIEYVSITPDRRQSKTLTISTNVDQKSLETEFLIVICRPTGDKWQSKTLFLAVFVPRSSIGKGVFDCRLSGVSMV